MAPSSGATSATGPRAEVAAVLAKPFQFEGSRVAARLLRLAGWSVHFDGLPAPQGVVIVYPHTSNWDFLVGMLAKWALGLPLRFWAKDSLFRVPVFGGWLRRRGGVPVDRSNPQGLVGDMVRQVLQEKAANRVFWLGIAPEGTRSAGPGWRTGFYRVAHQAQVPLGLVALDYGRKEVRFIGFLQLTGDEAADMARIAALYDGVRGLRHEQAAPIQLLGPRPPSDTMAR